MSKVEQAILDELKKDATETAEVAGPPLGRDARQLAFAAGATDPAVRRTLANMTRRGLVVRKGGYGLNGQAFRYFLLLPA